MKQIYIKHLIIFVSVCIGLYAIISIGLKVYTRHGDSYPVPDFSGMTIAEALPIIKSNHLRFQINDSLYNNAAEPGIILSQNPKAGVHVKNNRRVFFVINATQPEKVEAPSLVGISFRQARSLIEERGLQVGDISYVPDIAKNNVLEQKFQGKPLAPGTLIVKGSFIDLVLGEGEESISAFSGNNDIVIDPVTENQADDIIEME